MKIKICGLRRFEDVEYVNEAMPDYIGFVFYEKSKRNITPEQAKKLRKKLDRRIKAVGVFVNADIDFIMELVSGRVIDAVQLHGDEDFAYISRLKNRLGKSYHEVGYIEIIKAVSIKSAEDFEMISDIDLNYVLLDNGKGGTGQAFDWSLISDNLDSFNRDFFLAGGINAENIAEAIKLNPYCVDVSSGAETCGLKDREKIIRLIGSVRNA